jgi:hypothetical protein
MSVIFSYITKRWSVNEKPELMRAETFVWYLYGTMVSQGNWFFYLSFTAFPQLYFFASIFFTLLKRDLFSVPTTIAETSRCDLVSCSFCFRQHLQLDFEVLHVGDLSETRNQFLSRFGYCHKIQGNCLNRIHSRHRLANAHDGLYSSLTWQYEGKNKNPDVIFAFL